MMKATGVWFCLTALGLAPACKTTTKDQSKENAPRRCVTRIKVEQDLLWLSYADQVNKRVTALSMTDPLNPSEVLAIDVEYEKEPKNTVYVGDSLHIFSIGNVFSYTGVQSRKPVKTGQKTWTETMDGNRVVVQGDQFFMSGPVLSRGVIENGALIIKNFIEKLDYRKEGSEDIVLTDEYLYNLRPRGLEVVEYKDKDSLTFRSEIELNHAQRMLRSGHYLYMVGTSRLESTTNDEVGLQIVDIKEPLAPRYVKAIPIQGMEEDMEEWNGKLYIGGKGVFHTVDKSDPENPRIIHTLDLTGLGGNLPGIDGSVDSITIRPDGIAYVALVCQGWLILDLRGTVPVIVKRIP
jgi:hypothetical protein